MACDEDDEAAEADEEVSQWWLGGLIQSMSMTMGDEDRIFGTSASDA